MKKKITVTRRDACPFCGVSLIGKPIPKAIRAAYAPPYRWRREIAIYDREKDRTIAYKCPDCGKRWDR
jgi:predicted RNA-binding Zn-ribbon protein involved in translation (DUF1610 family)